MIVPVTNQEVMNAFGPAICGSVLGDVDIERPVIKPVDNKLAGCLFDHTPETFDTFTVEALCRQVNDYSWEVEAVVQIDRGTSSAIVTFRARSKHKHLVVCTMKVDADSQAAPVELRDEVE